MLELEHMFINFEYMVIVHYSDQSYIWWRKADTIEKTLTNLSHQGIKYEVILNKQYDIDRRAGAKIATQEVLQKLKIGWGHLPPAEQHLLEEYRGDQE